MREPNFSIPAANRASVGITTALYDRRALDCTSSLPLINSLSHLAYLTATSARIRDTVTVDGGVERLVWLLQQTRNQSINNIGRWNLAFQCVVNIGVRGSENVRIRLAEADIVPVLATILLSDLGALAIPQLVSAELQRSATKFSSRPLTRDIIDDERIFACSYFGSSERPSISEDFSSYARYDRGSTLSVADNGSMALGKDAESGAKGNTGHSSQTDPGHQIPHVGSRGRFQSSIMLDTMRAGFKPLITGNSSSGRQHASLTYFPTAQGIDYQYPQDSVAGDGNLESISSTISDSFGAVGLNDSKHLIEDLPTIENGAITPNDHSMTQYYSTSTDESTNDQPSEDTDANHNVFSHHPVMSTRMHLHPSIIAAPSDLNDELRDENPCARSDLSNSARSQTEPSLFRPEDVLMSLQLLAYLSKYCSLRGFLQSSHFLSELLNNRTKRPRPLEQARSESTDYTMCNLMDREGKSKSTHINIFSLVEQFTSHHRPQEIQYWARVVMRNLCRKDETKGGIRQCASHDCGRWEATPHQFAKCRRCRRTKYCGKDCQKNAWYFHRYWCASISE